MKERKKKNERVSWSSRFMRQWWKVINKFNYTLKTYFLEVNLVTLHSDLISSMNISHKVANTCSSWMCIICFFPKLKWCVPSALLPPSSARSSVQRLKLSLLPPNTPEAGTYPPATLPRTKTVEVEMTAVFTDQCCTTQLKHSRASLMNVTESKTQCQHSSALSATASIRTYRNLTKKAHQNDDLWLIIELRKE